MRTKQIEILVYDKVTGGFLYFEKLKIKRKKQCYSSTFVSFEQGVLSRRKPTEAIGGERERKCKTTGGFTRIMGGGGRGAT